MRRRSFLEWLVYTMGMLASAAMPVALSRMLAPADEIKPTSHLRPPGALTDDNAFIAACIGCGLCGEVCPRKCIQFRQRDGGVQVSTPYIDPEQKACTLCAKCMQVCPTDALTVVPVREVDMGIAQIDRGACYPWVDTGICGACVSICPLGEAAIRFELWNQYRPVVLRGCVGCGLCVEVCPHPSLPIKIVARSRGSVTRHSVADSEGAVPF
ncbi:MAG: 4Fe-4S dicluster domain-containing protein [Gammaproteobacteria bacterium]|nr:4Fe-4S dicluster domain-containing protein [Gammaproteobacteria bacterium]